MSKWETNKDGFADALRNNEYAEYKLDEYVTLVTDEDSEPYVCIPNEEYPEMYLKKGSDKIVELLESQILDIFTWDTIVIDQGADNTYFYFYGIEY